MLSVLAGRLQNELSDASGGSDSVSEKNLIAASNRPDGGVKHQSTSGSQTLEIPTRSGQSRKVHKHYLEAPLQTARNSLKNGSAIARVAASTMAEEARGKTTQEIGYEEVVHNILSTRSYRRSQTLSDCKALRIRSA